MRSLKRIIPIIVVVMLAATVLTGCSEGETSNAQKSGQKQTEQAFKQQSTAVPYPAVQLKDSLERRNLKERLLRQNKADSINYLYILSFGKPLGYYTIKGKVSSTQSQMTTDQLIVKSCTFEGDCPTVVSAPGDDGSYGANESGIFFFTTEGVMVTTNLDYVVSEQPIAFNVPELNPEKK